MNGFDASCLDVLKKYYQNIVLISKADVSSFNLYSDNERNRIFFSLGTGKSGFLFRAPELSSSLTASWAKTEESGIPLYDHSVSVPIVGVEEAVKILLKQLDQSNVFAAIQFKDNTVEIYGFNYGLKTQDYDYQAQGGIGGSIINLKSRELEYDPPYIYLPVAITPGQDVFQQAVIDFDNLFADIPNVNSGDFNNDFSNDFLIE